MVIDYQIKSKIAVIQIKIQNLKENLSSSDYEAIKFAEGVLSADDFTDIKTKRQGWRDEINTLQSQIEQITNSNKEGQ